MGSAGSKSKNKAPKASKPSKSDKGNPSAVRSASGPSSSMVISGPLHLAPANKQGQLPPPVAARPASSSSGSSVSSSPRLAPVMQAAAVKPVAKPKLSIPQRLEVALAKELAAEIKFIGDIVAERGQKRQDFFDKAMGLLGAAAGLIPSDVGQAAASVLIGVVQYAKQKKQDDSYARLWGTLTGMQEAAIKSVAEEVAFRVTRAYRLGLERCDEQDIGDLARVGAMRSLYYALTHPEAIHRASDLADQLTAGVRLGASGRGIKDFVNNRLTAPEDGLVWTIEGFFGRSPVIIDEGKLARNGLPMLTFYNLNKTQKYEPVLLARSEWSGVALPVQSGVSVEDQRIHEICVEYCGVMVNAALMDAWLNSEEPSLRDWMANKMGVTPVWVRYHGVMPKADWSGRVLAGCDFSGSDWSDVGSLAGLDVAGARFFGAKGLSAQRLVSARGVAEAFLGNVELGGAVMGSSAETLALLQDKRWDAITVKLDEIARELKEHDHRIGSLEQDKQLTKQFEQSEEKVKKDVKKIREILLGGKYEAFVSFVNKRLKDHGPDFVKMLFQQNYVLEHEKTTLNIFILFFSFGNRQCLGYSEYQSYTQQKLKCLDYLIEKKLIDLGSPLYQEGSKDFYIALGFAGNLLAGAFIKINPYAVDYALAHGSREILFDVRPGIYEEGLDPNFIYLTALIATLGSKELAEPIAKHAEHWSRVRNEALAVIEVFCRLQGLIEPEQTMGQSLVQGKLGMLLKETDEILDDFKRYIQEYDVDKSPSKQRAARWVIKTCETLTSASLPTPNPVVLSRSSPGIPVFLQATVSML
jgi:hypothetical protein